MNKPPEAHLIPAMHPFKRDPPSVVDMLRPKSATIDTTESSLPVPPEPAGFPERPRSALAGPAEDALNLITKAALIPALSPEQPRAGLFRKIWKSSPKVDVADADKARPEEEDTATSETDSSDDFKPNWVRKRKSMKKAQEAERYFVRTPEGITYVPDSLWMAKKKFAVNTHLYVGLDASERPETIRANARTAIPVRVRIVNELLLEEMKKICTFGDLNHDHVAPFQTLVLYDQEFRKALAKREAEFNNSIRRSYRDHPAVMRQDCEVPDTVAYGVVRLDGTPPDEIDRIRLTLDGLRALVSFLNTNLKSFVAVNDHAQQLSQGQKHSQLQTASRVRIQKIPFSHLWFLFTPGMEIVKLLPYPQVFRVLQVTGGRTSLRSQNTSNLDIDCFSLDFDGTELGSVSTTFYIRPYSGTVLVSDLVVFPLLCAEPELRERLLARGRKFQSLCQVSHRRYQGLSLKEGGRFDMLEEIDSDVIVDFELAYRHNEGTISVPKFRSGVIQSPTTEDADETFYQGIAYDDTELVRRRWAAFADTTELLRNQLPKDLGEDSLLLLPYRVYAFALLDRRWLPLHIDLVKDIVKIKPGENDGFQKLVLPEGHKNIVRALVNTHLSRQATAEHMAMGTKPELDVVRGKGRGIIILLHGAPGVGKTSTAECVAANAGCPLLSITCGDLGANTASEVEKNLETYFELARKWRCVLLLDEADVFLGAREKGDILQVSLVSVFLRVLEYYPGILILTTNRVGSFDEGIKSRVHCALYYPPLSKTQSRDIWNMVLDTLDANNASADPALKVRYNRKAIEKFGRRHWKHADSGTRWNGRQIKNAFQMAIALAEWDHQQESDVRHPEGPMLKVSHFETVARASAEFDNYLVKVRGTDEFRAKAHETRRDDIAGPLEPEKSTSDKARKTATRWPKTKPSPRSRSKRATPGSSEESSSDSSEESTTSSEEEEDSELESSEEEEPPPPKSKKKHSKKKREE